MVIPLLRNNETKKNELLLTFCGMILSPKNKKDSKIHGISIFLGPLGSRNSKVGILLPVNDGVPPFSQKHANIEHKTPSKIKRKRDRCIKATWISLWMQVLRAGGYHTEHFCREYQIGCKGIPEEILDFFLVWILSVTKIS